MHTNRFAQQLHFRGTRAFSRPLNVLGPNYRRNENFVHRPKTKLRIVAPVPEPTPTPVIESRKAPQPPPAWAWSEDSFTDEEVATHVEPIGDHPPSRMPRALIWNAAKDAVQAMPQSTDHIDRYSRVTHVYCGLALNKPGRHATLRYVHAQMMERLARIWRQRRHMSLSGLDYLAQTILRDLERRIMDLFEQGRDMPDERPQGRLVRQCRMPTGRRRACFFTYESHGQDGVPYILTLQDGRCHDKRRHRSRLQPRHRVRRPKELRLCRFDF